MLKAYIGAKIILGEPMDLKTFRFKYHKDNPTENAPGYHVVYPNPEGDYHSWSPKDVFENAYRGLTPGEVNFILDEYTEVKEGAVGNDKK